MRRIPLLNEIPPQVLDFHVKVFYASINIHTNLQDRDLNADRLIAQNHVPQ